MNDNAGISQEQIDKYYEKLKKDSEAAGYNLNPDVEFVKELITGLLTNDIRYGYQACPCRLAAGDKEKDLDMICPCDYRDPDLTDFDACYCALYVSQKVVRKEKQVVSIPDRRKSALQSKQTGKNTVFAGTMKLSLPVWRCTVCGYLCARENPPEICPVCKVKKDRFERFI
jgi:ferredoxin-thioredoxin reductase catalytic subunit